MKRGIFLNVSISSKDSSKKKYLLEKFLFASKSDLCEFINHLMFLHTTHFAGIKWNWFSIFENIHLRYLLTKQNQSWFVQYLPPLCRLPCNKNFCHCWSYCQWGTCWGPPPSTSCSSWSLSSCLWTGRRHLRKWVLFYLSTVASPESGEGKGGSAVAFPKHLSSHCGVKNIVIAIN